MESKKIKLLISGAGVAGLALAQGINLYLKDFFEFEIIEKDQEFESRKQGYSLTIQQNGQEVFKFLNLFDKLYQDSNSVKGRGHNLFNSDGKLLSKSKGSQNKNSLKYIFLPRQQLRKILIQNLEVQWGVTIQNYKKNYQNQIEVQLSNGKEFIYDYIICAEGVFSQLRTQIVKDVPIYLNVVMINGIVKNNKSVECKHSYSIIDNGINRLFFKPYKPGYFMWQLTHKCSLEEAQFLQQQQPQKWIDKTIQEIGDWKHGIIDLVKQTQLDMLRCGPLFFRQCLDNTEFYDKISEQNNNIIFIGDSAHPMPPFKGQGANQALQDVQDFIELFQNLKSKNIISNDIIQKYQQGIIQRAKKVQMQSVKKVEENHNFILNQDQSYDNNK